MIDRYLGALESFSLFNSIPLNGTGGHSSLLIVLFRLTGKCHAFMGLEYKEYGIVCEGATSTLLLDGRCPA